MFMVSGLDSDDQEIGIYLTDEDVGEIVQAMVENGSPDTFMLSDLEYSAVLYDDRVFKKICSKIVHRLMHDGHVDDDFCEGEDYDELDAAVSFPYEIIELAEQVIEDGRQGKMQDIIAAAAMLGVMYWYKKNQD